MLSLQAVRQSGRDLLWNVFQKYMYEMSYLYPEEMDEEEETVLLFDC